MARAGRGGWWLLSMGGVWWRWGGSIAVMSAWNGSWQLASVQVQQPVLPQCERRGYLDFEPGSVVRPAHGVESVNRLGQSTCAQWRRSDQHRVSASVNAVAPPVHHSTSATHDQERMMDRTCAKVIISVLSASDTIVSHTARHAGVKNGRPAGAHCLRPEG